MMPEGLVRSFLTLNLSSSLVPSPLQACSIHILIPCLCLDPL
jgi:hypothetical protein